MSATRLLLLVAMLVCALNPRLIHQQTTADNQAYVDALLSEEAKLQESLAKIQENIKFLHETLNQLSSTPEVQIVALEDALADEVALLSDLQQNTTLPLQLKNVDCKNISEADLNQIKLSIQQLRTNLDDIKAQIDALAAKVDPSQQTIIDNLNIEKEWTENYLGHLEQLTLVSCPEQNSTYNITGNTSAPGFANVNDYKYITRYENQSYIYGSTNETQYNMDLFSYMTANNVQKCPPETPYAIWSNNSCINCSDPTPLFDLGASQCTACQANEYFVPQSPSCLNSNCQGGSVYNNATNQCICPGDRPFSNGQICVSCYLPNYWNKDTLSCESCGPNAVFDVGLG